MTKIALLALVLACQPAVKPEVITVTSGEAAGLSNAHLILGEREAILVDTLLTKPDVDRLARRIAESNRKLTTIFITHAHADHFLGLAQLLERFPDAKAVTTPGVIEDIHAYGRKYFSTATNAFGKEGPERMVTPEPVSSLQLEGRELRVLAFRGGETENAAALYDPASRTLFAGDLVFHDVHLNLRENRHEGWRGQLESIDVPVERIYPGHGPAGDRALIDETRRYLDDFLDALKTNDADEIRRRMLSRYPRHARRENLESSIAAVFPH